MSDFVVEIKNQDIEINVNPKLIEIEIDRSIGSMYPEYTGQTVVTPTRQSQTLLTKNKSMGENVVINPIPQNYGLITYNSSYLIVS